jgi:hypothetical protein
LVVLRAGAACVQSVAAKEIVTTMRKAIVRSFAYALGVAVLFGLHGCLENDEDIIVHPDGSLEVQMSAKGSPDDLADGYALPLEGPWRALDDTTLAWIAKVGPDTGSAQTRERVAAGAFDVPKQNNGDTRLSVGAHFASAAQLPHFFAPQREPYRSAYLERETQLAIAHKGARDVYTFERKLLARRWSDWEVFDSLEGQLPEETQKRLTKNEPLSETEWPLVTNLVRNQYRHSTAAFARDAMGAVYTLGDASLATQAVSSALAAVDREIGELVNEQRLRTMYDAMRGDKGEKAGELAPELNPDLLVRDALRRALSNALAAADVSEATRNTVRARLEWDFTAFDQTGDLGDEEFKLSVCLPGVAVDGNFDSSVALVVDGIACSKLEWSFKGEELRDHDKSLRAVSVVE